MEKTLNYPPGFFSDIETSKDFDIENPFKGKPSIQLRSPAGFSLGDSDNEKNVEEKYDSPQYREAAAKSGTSAVPPGFFGRKSKTSKAKSITGPKNVPSGFFGVDDKDANGWESDSDNPPPLPPSIDIFFATKQSNVEEKLEDSPVEARNSDARNILKMLERSASHKNMTKKPSFTAKQSGLKEDDILARFESNRNVDKKNYRNITDDEPEVVMVVGNDDDILAQFENAKLPSFHPTQRDPVSPIQKLDFAKSSNTVTASSPRANQAPELPARRLKKGESSQSILTQTSEANSPFNSDMAASRRMWKPESSKSVLQRNDSQHSITPPELPVRRIKKTESSQSVNASEASNPPVINGGKEIPRRRRTSFLEMLLKEKQERGEFDPFSYTENQPVLAPEEEVETGMTKQEIEEKIRRIAQASAAGHNTSGMGIGLRDIGYAVAKSRGDAASNGGGENRKLNVRSIAKHAEEIYVTRRDTSNASGQEQGGRTWRDTSNASAPEYPPQDTTRSRNPSTSSVSSAVSIRVPGMHPQQARTMQFDPIGEVSEGAYSVGNSSSFTDRKPSVNSQQQKQPGAYQYQQTLRVNGLPKQGKSKAERFFGSMRLSFAEASRASKNKKDKIWTTLKDKATLLASRAKEFAGRVKERAEDKTYEFRARTRAALSKKRSERDKFDY